MRESNAIDFWRGFALVNIFVNHVPGNAFARFTYPNASLSDAAELFVFLAGWALGLATRGRDGREPAGRVVVRLAARAVEVYRAHVTTTAIALAMIAGAALAFDNPVFLEWHNAGPVFSDPLQTTIGWVTLLHQLGYFNILPLYVALLVMAPAFVLLARWSRGTALAASLALWAWSLAFEKNLPTWPVEGTWFFNPFAWQLLLVLGYLCCEWSRDSAAFGLWTKRLLPLGVLGVAIGAVVALRDLKPDPLLVPEPRLFFIFSKSNVSPGRLLHFLALLLAFQGVYRLVAPHLPWLAMRFSALGRNSLAVFSMGSLLSLAGQLVRFRMGGGFLIDCVIMAVGLAGLVFTAWFVEWRTRLPRPSRSA